MGNPRNSGLTQSNFIANGDFQHYTCFMFAAHTRRRFNERTWDIKKMFPSSCLYDLQLLHVTVV